MVNGHLNSKFYSAPQGFVVLDVFCARFRPPREASFTKFL